MGAMLQGNVFANLYPRVANAYPEGDLMTTRKSDPSASEKDPIVIKKYANRRLYDTESSAYVTLDHLAQLVRDGTEFMVQDARSGEDITRSVLTQIILEQENRGASMLPMNFLRQMIRFYGDSMQSVLPAYLDMSMESFTKSQEKMREHLANGMSGLNPLAAMNPMNPMTSMSGAANLKNSAKMMEEQVRTNMGLFDEAFRAWSSAFQTPATLAAAAMNPATTSRPAKPAAPAEMDEEAEDVDHLRQELAAMKSELAELRKLKAAKKN